MSEIKEFYYSIPPFSRYYLSAIFALSFMLTYMKSQRLISFISYLFLDFQLVFKKLQIWRLFTNLFIIGPFSMNFLMFCLMFYSIVVKSERQAIYIKRYAEFLMMIFYLIISLNLINYLSYIFFDIKPSVTLTGQFLHGLIYIDSKRDPERLSQIYFITVKNAYVPFCFMLFHILTGGSIYDDIIGILAGHLYFFLKDIIPITYHKDILVTPTYVIYLTDKLYYEQDEHRN